jgi:hypothetical protein
LDVGGRDGDEQQRHADPVVQAALHIQPLADPGGNPRLGDHRLAERGIRRRQHHPHDQRLLDAQLPEDRRGRQRAERDRQRQPDGQQAYRDVRVAAQLPQVDPRGIAEEHQRQSRLRECLYRRARARKVELVEHLRTDEQTDAYEQHRRRDRRAADPP